MSTTHTEDERGAATMIQAAARGHQGRLFKARVERGSEGAAAVFDAFMSAKIPKAEEVPSEFTGVGAVYMSARGSFGEPPRSALRASTRSAPPRSPSSLRRRRARRRGSR